MQTQLADFMKQDPDHNLADSILRSCVHCGFCLATCPTYQVLGSELDSPRGRIYLMKQVLEGAEPTHKTLTHLDRCLTCRACETTCPSGVKYGQLLDIGRRVVEDRIERPTSQALLRGALQWLLPKPWLFTPLAKLGRRVRPLLPGVMKKKLPPRLSVSNIKPKRTEGPIAIIHEGCVQPGLAQQINEASVYLLDALGYQVQRVRLCCGAVEQHLSNHPAAQRTMHKLIDRVSNPIQEGAVLISNASGCGAQLKEFGHLLRHNDQLADAANSVSEHTLDIVEVLKQHKERLTLKPQFKGVKIAVHIPCTLQHGQQLGDPISEQLAGLGVTLAATTEAHLCCGSAGTYSVLEPETSQQLKSRKLTALSSDHPSLIVTANIGCLTHLQEDSPVPILHWIELLDVTPTP